MQNNIFMIILWLVCGVATVIAAVLASRSRQARYIGRAAVGVLFIAGGALLHVINLATGGDYAGFADPSHFAWVTHTWNAVVVPNHILFIGLLAVFEATAGVLTISGGRKTQLGYLAVIAFYLALWLFGWIETAWVLIMLPAMLLLLRAERRAAPGHLPGVHRQEGAIRRARPLNHRPTRPARATGGDCHGSSQRTGKPAGQSRRSPLDD